MKHREKIFSRYKEIQMDPLLGRVTTEEDYLRYGAVLKRKLGHFLPKDKSAKILDLGCGMGFLLHMLKREGYRNALGVEVNRDQVELARRFGLQVVEEDVMAFMENNREKFHLVFVNHLLEHLSKKEVLDLLELVFHALEKGGKILVAVPNASSPLGLPLAFGDFTHEVFFSPNSLREVLMVSGFSQIEVKGERITGLGWKGWAKSLLWKGFSLLVKAPLLLLSKDSGFYILEPVIQATGVKDH